MAHYRDLFLPPINRAMQILDRSFFQKTISLTAADIFEKRNIPRVQRECALDVLDAPHMKHPTVTVSRGDKDRTLLLLRPGIKPDDDLKNYSQPLQNFLSLGWLGLVPYQIKLEYDYWSYEEILRAILPEDLPIPPRSFQPIGHIGNLTLRPEYTPYKTLIASILLSKTPQLKTIVTKPTPTSPLTILTGDPNTTVTVREAGCDLKFDYAHTEYDPTLIHATKLLLSRFPRRSAIAEVSAGPGTLTIQAAKKKHLVYANNPNPLSHASLVSNIPPIPPLPDLIYTFNLPPREFLRTAVRSLLASRKRVALPKPHNNKAAPPPKPMLMKVPTLFNHFVVPASVGGLEFLSAFRGLYEGLGIGYRVMPWIHVYTYHERKSLEVVKVDVVAGVREGLGFEIPSEEVEVELAVEGKERRLFRVRFRLPKEVALGKVEKKWRRKKWVERVSDSGSDSDRDKLTV